MKKVLFILLFSVLGLASFASVGNLKVPVKKIVTTEKKVTNYPVTATLSCNITITFTSSCTGTVAECIPYWNAAIEAADQLLCGTPQA